MAESTMNEHFVGLLMQLHYTAWVQLGKVANPATGKVERHLEAAKATIDILGAVDEKTKGNLHADEEKLLTRMLLELRMNYVEEAQQGAAAPAKPAAPAEKGDAPAGTASAAPAGGTAPEGTADPPEAAPGPDAK